MSLVIKSLEASLSQPASPNRELVLPLSDISQESSLSCVRSLYEMVAERKIGSWQKLHKPRPDGVIVEIAFGEAPFLAGDTNSKLQNLIALLEGKTLRNVSATAVLKYGDRPNGRELCLSCPVALRAKVSTDSLPRQDVVDDVFRAVKRDYQTEIEQLSLADVTHIGLFQARQESILPKWESQLSLLREILSKSLNQEF